MLICLRVEFSADKARERNLFSVITITGDYFLDRLNVVLIWRLTWYLEIGMSVRLTMFQNLLGVSGSV